MSIYNLYRDNNMTRREMKMVKKTKMFSVVYKETATKQVFIEAESEEEAREKWWHEDFDDDDTEYIDGDDKEIIEIEEADE